ncbi:elongation factor Ts [Alphaproteobacteria bacterium]|nr:elongation factor Ts [Alphaproteobacteria bacterium]
MKVSAQLVKTLRDKTGAGMMDCKRMLVEANCDLEIAEDLLRQKGLTDAAKKLSRVAADGLVAIAISSDKKKASMIEINSETDFVARNEKFQAFVSNIAKAALETDSVVDIVNLKYPNSENLIKDEITRFIATSGENISLRRIKTLSVQNGCVAWYVHNAVNHCMGKIGVLVAFESDGDSSIQIDDIGKKLAMHIAAANPLYLCPDCVPIDILDKEKVIAIAQAQEMGKTSSVAEKMAEGKIAKYFEESTLFEQFFVMNNKIKIKDVIADFNKEHNCNIKISAFSKFVLGEGIEKAESNFAEEVQACL